MRKKMFKILLLAGVCLFIFASCGSNEDDFALSEIFAAQNHDELIQIFTELTDLHAYPEVEYELLSLLTMQGRPIEEYLEDFDFLVDLIDADIVSDLTAPLRALRDGIENFYYMNDFIFTLLLFGEAYISGIFDDMVGGLPFKPLPYIAWGNSINYNDYIITPNRILIIVYDF